MKGIDCATRLTEKSAKALAAAGAGFVGRYLVPSSYAWKRMVRTEAEAITAAGMKIISVFQKGKDGPAGGAANGMVDGKQAYYEAQLIGQPLGSAIYFACDWEVGSSQMPAIEAYLRAVASQLPGYGVGVYGSYAVIEAMAARKACQHFWQTCAWSYGKKSDHANLYQYQNDVVVAGIQLDHNLSYGNEGFWDTRPILEDEPMTTAEKEAFKRLEETVTKQAVRQQQLEDRLKDIPAPDWAAEAAAHYGPFIANLPGEQDKAPIDVWRFLTIQYRKEFGKMV